MTASGQGEGGITSELPSVHGKEEDGERRGREQATAYVCTSNNPPTKKANKNDKKKRTSSAKKSASTPTPRALA